LPFNFRSYWNGLGKTVETGCTPAGGNGPTGEVPETEATRTSGEAPADGGATMSPGDIETANATEVNANQRPEDAESLLTMVEDVRWLMEDTIHAEVPEV
jgi:hypothetical protein